MVVWSREGKLHLEGCILETSCAEQKTYSFREVTGEQAGQKETARPMHLWDRFQGGGGNPLA